MTRGDGFWRLERLSDRALLQRIGVLVRSGRRLSAELVAHLGEVEERRLHLDAGHGSMFAYCVSSLALSEDEACRRIDVARLARKFPSLFPLLANGQVSLTVAALLKPYLTSTNAPELLKAVSGCSVQKAREKLAEHFPRPDVPATVRKIPERRIESPATVAAAPRVGVASSLGASSSLSGAAAAAAASLAAVPVVTVADAASSLRGASSAAATVADAGSSLGASSSSGASSSFGAAASWSGASSSGAASWSGASSSSSGASSSAAVAFDAAVSSADGATSSESAVTVPGALATSGAAAAALPVAVLSAATVAPVVTSAIMSAVREPLLDVQAGNTLASPQLELLEPSNPSQLPTGARAFPSVRSSARRSVEPLSPGRYKVQFTADAELKAKLELARDLLRHAQPDGDLAAIIGRALDLLVERLMQRKFGARCRRLGKKGAEPCGPPASATAVATSPGPESTASPAPTVSCEPTAPPAPPEPTAAPEPTASSEASEPSEPSRYITAEARRAVLERNGLRCSFRGANGMRCDARAWLEHDHVHPRGKGGDSSPSNLRLLCRAHNRRAAEREYGRCHVEEAIAERSSFDSGAR